MIKYKTDMGHAEFVFKVIGPNGVSFHIMDRYSSMRAFMSLLKKDVDDNAIFNDLPPFPKKKYIGSMEAAFLT